MPYKGSHRVVYVYRFYTSVELIKELEKMKLYMTGTVMSNRIPDRLRITKCSTAGFCRIKPTVGSTK
jgi:hypothetical protein